AAVAGALALAALVQVSGTAFGVPPPGRLPWRGTPWYLNSRPNRAPWPHREILSAVARDAGGAAATVSVVPNHERFSVANFRYYARRDGLPLRFVRAWDDAPLGVDYMILKSGDQGPAWTVERARRVVDRLARDPALARVFPVIAELPLPDGSVAVVRGRRVDALVDAPTPALARAVETALRSRVGEVARDVEGLEIEIEHDAALHRGVLRRVVVAARAATLGELRRREAATLRVHDIELVLEDVLVNPYSAWEARRLEPLDVGRLRLTAATIRADDLRRFLAGVKAFRSADVRLANGAVAVHLAQPGPDVWARVRLVPAAARPFALAVEDVRLGGAPVPSPLIDWVVRHYDPTARLASRLPFPVEVGPIVIGDDAVRVGAAPR
ncbi:MAG TPA: hypothetical protein VFX28_21670, partial [Methylomirabilota bacterium]|nr:hypothetical protein [Methylomirabilota bacterium]